MKKIFYLFMLSVAIYSCSDNSKKSGEDSSAATNNAVVDSFKVWGNCEMCKETIEGSLKVEGIIKANWNTETKMITLNFDSSKIKLDQIQKNIASVGYDNIKYTGNETAYMALPACCQYQRK